MGVEGAGSLVQEVLVGPSRRGVGEEEVAAGRSLEQGGQVREAQEAEEGRRSGGSEHVMEAQHVQGGEQQEAQEEHRGLAEEACSYTKHPEQAWRFLVLQGE